jgi:hypothetical protein
MEIIYFILSIFIFYVITEFLIIYYLNKSKFKIINKIVLLIISIIPFLLMSYIFYYISNYGSFGTITLAVVLLVILIIALGMNFIILYILKPKNQKFNLPF